MRVAQAQVALKYRVKGEHMRNNSDYYADMQAMPCPASLIRPVHPPRPPLTSSILIAAAPRAPSSRTSCSSRLGASTCIKHPSMAERIG